MLLDSLSSNISKCNPRAKSILGVEKRCMIAIVSVDLIKLLCNSINKSESNGEMKRNNSLEARGCMSERMNEWDKNKSRELDA